MEKALETLLAQYTPTQIFCLMELHAWNRFAELKGDASIEGMQKAIDAASVAEKIRQAKEILKGM